MITFHEIRSISRVSSVTISLATLFAKVEVMLHDGYSTSLYQMHDEYASM